LSVTPTRTITPSITVTPSITPTATVSRTPSITPTSSITPSRTITPSITPTPTITATPSITPTRTITPTPTITMTPTPTVSPCNCTEYKLSYSATSCTDVCQTESTSGYRTCGPIAVGKVIYTGVNCTAPVAPNGYYRVEFDNTCYTVSGGAGVITTSSICASITPTPTITQTVTPSITPTPTRTQTPSVTPTPTFTPTPTITPTPVYQVIWQTTNTDSTNGDMIVYRNSNVEVFQTTDNSGTFGVSVGDTIELAANASGTQVAASVSGTGGCSDSMCDFSSATAYCSITIVSGTYDYYVYLSIAPC